MKKEAWLGRKCSHMINQNPLSCLIHSTFMNHIRWVYKENFHHHPVANAPVAFLGILAAHLGAYFGSGPEETQGGDLFTKTGNPLDSHLNCRLFWFIPFGLKARKSSPFHQKSSTSLSFRPQASDSCFVLGIQEGFCVRSAGVGGGGESTFTWLWIPIWVR